MVEALGKPSNSLAVSFLEDALACLLLVVQWYEIGTYRFFSFTSYTGESGKIKVLKLGNASTEITLTNEANSQLRRKIYAHFSVTMLSISHEQYYVLSFSTFLLTLLIWLKTSLHAPEAERVSVYSCAKTHIQYIKTVSAKKKIAKNYVKIVTSVNPGPSSKFRPLSSSWTNFL